MTEERYNKSISLKNRIYEIDKLIELMEGKVKRTTYENNDWVILHYNRLASIDLRAIDDNHSSYNNTYRVEIPSYLYPRILNTLKECKNEFEKEFSEL